MKTFQLIPVLALFLALAPAARAGSEMAPTQVNPISSAENAPGYWVPASDYPPDYAEYPPAYYGPGPGYYGPGPVYYGYRPRYYGPPVGIFFGFGFHGHH